MSTWLRGLGVCESHAVLYFDEVTVPWERVFVVGDVAMCQKQFHATPAHVYQN